MSVEQYSALTEDIEHKLDEADEAAEKSDVRYSASQVFGRVGSMSVKRFKLFFLPLFEADLIEITDYISNRLNNPELSTCSTKSKISLEKLSAISSISV